jgi:cytochrome c oxidase cbb3-type subunit 3
MTRMIGLGVALGACIALVACAPPPGDIAASSQAPAPLDIPVGPVPGIQDETPQVTNPFTGDRAAAGEGRRLFTRYNCAGCHGEHGGGGMGPSLRDIDWLYGSHDAHVYASIVQGRAHGMPSWGRSLSADQVWRLVSYIRSLRTTSEPDPPVSS